MEDFCFSAPFSAHADGEEHFANISKAPTQRELHSQIISDWDVPPSKDSRTPYCNPH